MADFLVFTDMEADDTVAIYCLLQHHPKNYLIVCETEEQLQRLRTLTDKATTDIMEAQRFLEEHPSACVVCLCRPTALMTLDYGLFQQATLYLSMGFNIRSLLIGKEKVSQESVKAFITAFKVAYCFESYLAVQGNNTMEVPLPDKVRQLVRQWNDQIFSKTYQELEQYKVFSDDSLQLCRFWNNEQYKELLALDWSSLGQYEEPMKRKLKILASIQEKPEAFLIADVVVMAMALGYTMEKTMVRLNFDRNGYCQPEPAVLSKVYMALEHDVLDACKKMMNVDEIKEPEDGCHDEVVPKCTECTEWRDGQRCTATYHLFQTEDGGYIYARLNP